jgi:hypothetical protein
MAKKLQAPPVPSEYSTVFEVY